MFVLATLTATSLTFLAPTPAPLPQDPQGEEQTILDKSSLNSLNKKLRDYLTAQAVYNQAEEARDREKAAKKREDAKDKFRKDWDNKSKKGNLLASMPDLRAIYTNCFALDRPKKSGGTTHKMEVEFSETTKFEYAIRIPRKYKPSDPTRTVILLPGLKDPKATSSWIEPRAYLDQAFPKKSAALENTIFHVPLLPEGLDMDPAPDFSRDGQEAREDQRIGSIFGSFGQTMATLNVDRPRVFLDCGRGNSAFGLRFVSMFPDRFAGIILRDPTAIEDIRLGSLSGLQVAMIKTADNGAVVDALKGKLEEITPDCVTVIEAKGDYPFGGNADELDAWMSKHRRNMTPKKVIIEPNHDRFNRAYWARIERMNPVHGVAASDRPRFEVTADKESNRIEVKTQGVESFSLLLNDDLVNLDKEFTVVINGNATTERTGGVTAAGCSAACSTAADWDFLFPVQYAATVPKEEKSGTDSGSKVTAAAAGSDGNRPEGGPPDDGIRLGRGALVAGLAGFSLMAAELTAVRLQAPWFGDSAYVLDERHRRDPRRARRRRGARRHSGRS